MLTAACVSGGSNVAEAQKPSTFPAHDKVLTGFTKVVTKANIKPMYTVWERKSDGQMYAELPRTFATKKYFIALTVASGENYAGLQSSDFYVYWKKYDKRLALIQPNVSTRADGDREAKASVDRLFTDRLLMDLPIVTMGPGGGPVIDLDAMLVANAKLFFGSNAAPSAAAVRNGIFSISTSKVFKNNIEVAFEVPTNSGTLKILHYSISEIPDKTGYKTRTADARIGYFTTTFTDLSKYNDRETHVRYINRWHLEKADPKLRLSPPRNPIVFYIEHTTPVRYRRWVRKGVLAWNAAFEKVGIANAIEVYYQDAASGAHMDKDPEDVNYNFVRWLNNNISTAIGPSRVHPRTGQILDADIVLTDGWIRHYQKEFAESLPGVAMEGFGPETLTWLAQHPQWDPRIRLAHPSQRPIIAERILRQTVKAWGGSPLVSTDSLMMGDEEFDGLVGRHSQVNGMCLAAQEMSFDLAMLRMNYEVLLSEDDDDEDKKDKEDKKDEKKEKDESKEQLLDGMPESFVGPFVSHLVAHEVGHTLGLRHNFKASSVFSLDEINSGKVKGKQQLAGSVMDYIGTNIRIAAGDQQGDYCMTGVGPYDLWAIEYGYTFKDPTSVLKRVAEPELAFATDEDTSGPDPLARRYDFSRNPLDYAQEQVRLAKYHRQRLLSDFIKDGDSWDRIRYGYELTLRLQTRAISMMSNWVGGAHVHRDKKGDPNGRQPIEVVAAEKQRKALKFVLENALNDDAFGLNPELVTAMGLDKWSDNISSMVQESTWPIHDRVMGIQASALTGLMNPTTLKRVYDNEFRVPEDEDALTLPEMLTAITASVWSELEAEHDGEYSSRKPMISSFRRNLQREHLERLIDLTLPGGGSDAASRAISMLSAHELRSILTRIEEGSDADDGKIDPYTAAHLAQAKDRMQKALDADYILNSDSGGSGSNPFHFLLGRETPTQPDGLKP
jgi:Met-zincin/Domain of unknown function (DUF5117)